MTTFVFESLDSPGEWREGTPSPLAQSLLKTLADGCTLSITYPDGYTHKWKIQDEPLPEYRYESRTRYVGYPPEQDWYIESYPSKIIQDILRDIPEGEAYAVPSKSAPEARYYEWRRVRINQKEETVPMPNDTEAIFEHKDPGTSSWYKGTPSRKVRDFLLTFPSRTEILIKVPSDGGTVPPSPGIIWRWRYPAPKLLGKREKLIEEMEEIRRRDKENGIAPRPIHFANRDLSYANLSGLDLSNLNLRRADLRSANLSYCTLSNSFLEGANLSDANLSGANVRHTSLRRANLANTDLRGADFHGSDLTEATVDNARVYRANFSGATLVGVNFGLTK